MNLGTIAELQTSLRRNMILGFLACGVLVVSFGGWAATTQLTGAIIAHGNLVVDGNSKNVQHLSGGVIAELSVQEGEFVKAGQVVARLSDTDTKADLATIANSLVHLAARKARLFAERDGVGQISVPKSLFERLSDRDAEIAMSSERRLFEDRRKSRDSQKARLREQVMQTKEQILGLEQERAAAEEEMKLIAKELSGVRSLYDKGLTSIVRLNNLQRAHAKLNGEAGKLTASIARAKARISEIELQLILIDDTMKAEVSTEIRDVENKQAELIEKERKALKKLEQIDIKAPIAGTIHKLSVHTIGAVIKPAEILMVVVPSKSQLSVESRISPQDVDQLHVGQMVSLRFSAFNRNTTPELTGKLIRISADLEYDPQTGISFYRATTFVPKTQLELLGDLAPVPGMPVETFFITADRTVASYFMKPLKDHLQHVFRGE